MEDQNTAASVPSLPPPVPPTWVDPVGGASGGAGPLSPEHLQTLGEANVRMKKIRAACKVASFNGWTFVILAGGSALFGLVAAAMGERDVLSWVMAVALAIIGANEFAGRRMLLRLEGRGAALLGWNQIGLLAVVVGYCAWQLWAAEGTAGQTESQLKAYPEVTGLLGGMDVGETVRLFSLLVYGSVIAVSVIYQGWNAWYYFRRGELVRTHVAQTPAWAVEVQRIGADV